MHAHQAAIVFEKNTEKKLMQIKGSPVKILHRSDGVFTYLVNIHTKWGKKHEKQNEEEQNGREGTELA